LARRPSLTRLLELARTRKYNTVAVLALRHLGRTNVSVGKIVAELDACGARVIAASGVELPPKTARWLAEEGKAHREKIKRSLDGKRERSERTGEIPYGFRLHPDGIHLVEDWSEQRAIRRARALAAEGWSPSAIARELEGKYVNRAGRPHGRGAIRRWILRETE